MRPHIAIRDTIIHAAVTSARFPFLTQSAVLNDGAARRRSATADPTSAFQVGTRKHPDDRHGRIAVKLSVRSLLGE
jgi:hypothetical protein